MAIYAPVGFNSGYITKAATTVASTNIPATMLGKSAQFVLNNPVPWRICSLTCIYASTVTVGNRQIGLLISDVNGLPVIAAAGNQAAQVITASSTAYVMYSASNPVATSNTQWFGGALPDPCIIPPFCTIQFIDRAAIDAADTVTFQLSYVQ